MIHFRYAVSIIASVIMMAIGGFLTFLGTMSLLTTLKVHLFLEQTLPGSETTVNDALDEMNGGGLDLFADAVPWLIMLGELSIGLALLIFGIFRLMRRLQSGLPEEDEGAPTTAGGHLGQLLLYGLGGIFGLYHLAFLSLDLASHLSLEIAGESAEATIEARWKSKGDNDEERGVFYATYSYRTAAGQTFESKMRIPSHEGKHFVVGNRIMVNYLPIYPGFNEWAELRSLSDFILPMFFYAILLIGGFWGVMRNLDGGAGWGTQEAT